MGDIFSPPPNHPKADSGELGEGGGGVGAWISAQQGNCEERATFLRAAVGNVNSCTDLFEPILCILCAVNISLLVCLSLSKLGGGGMGLKRNAHNCVHFTAC